MSYFSIRLAELLKLHKQSDVATASGVPRSSIAQYASGDRGISVSALSQLLQAFPEEEDRLELVRAHLRDETPAEVIDRIIIECRCDSVREPRHPEAWEKDVDRALATLRARASDPDVRQLILDLERVL